MCQQIDRIFNKPLQKLVRIQELAAGSFFASKVVIMNTFCTVNMLT